MTGGGHEWGVFALAFHPDYAKNQRFFVYYVDKQAHSRLVEYRALPSLDRAYNKPIRTLFVQEQADYTIHYGGHIAFAMDALKVAVANLADLMDRQMALLVDPKYNGGLPANLTGAVPPRDRINHGLKALQISVSAWTAEALKLTMPASVFSRSTESHNQDKVSMGTIAARDCVRVLELTEQVAAALLIAPGLSAQTVTG